MTKSRLEGEFGESNCRTLDSCTVVKSISPLRLFLAYCLVVNKEGTSSMIVTHRETRSSFANPSYGSCVLHREVGNRTFRGRDEESTRDLGLCEQKPIFWIALVSQKKTR